MGSSITQIPNEAAVDSAGVFEGYGNIENGGIGDSGSESVGYGDLSEFVLRLNALQGNAIPSITSEAVEHSAGTSENHSEPSRAHQSARRFEGYGNEFELGLDYVPLPEVEGQELAVFETMPTKISNGGFR